MPSGLPNSSSLNSRHACVFSLDTSVIEAAGFRFSDGPLGHLAGQLPPWVQLWMPDIVLREIQQHRTDNVSRSIQQIQAGMLDLRRHIGDGFNQSDPEWLQHSRSFAANTFDAQLATFIESHNGIVLEPKHENLTARIFEMYFSGQPPFGGGKDKKHEFPDAASLLMLDYLAAERKVKVIAVSKDTGWKYYADQSENIYCVSSLQELAAMFISRTSEARDIQKRLGIAFKEPGTKIEKYVKTTLENGFTSFPWQIILPGSYRPGSDASVIETNLISFEIHPESMGVWITSLKNDACVAEIPIDVDVSLRVEIEEYKYDDHGKKIDVFHTQTIIENIFEVKIQLQLTGNLKENSVEDLIKKMELGDAPIDVVIGHNRFGANWISEQPMKAPWDEFDGTDDDIPF